MSQDTANFLCCCEVTVTSENAHILNLIKFRFFLLGTGGFEFCTSDDDDEPETVFRNAFRGNQQTYYWSFESDDFQRSNSRRSHSKSSRHWSYETDDEDEIPPQTEASVARQALGLNISGPLKLEDVKSA
jgi:hypothetical protein